MNAYLLNTREELRFKSAKLRSELPLLALFSVTLLCRAPIANFFFCAAAILLARGQTLNHLSSHPPPPHPHPLLKQNGMIGGWCLANRSILHNSSFGLPFFHNFLELTVFVYFILYAHFINNNVYIRVSCFELYIRKYIV